MTSPKQATTTNRGRFYSWRNENYWSVTTILGQGLPKPVLVNWAKKFTAEYAVHNYAKLGALLEPDVDGAVDEAAAIDWLKGAAFRHRDQAGDIGTLVHEAIEAYALGKPMPKWAPLVRPRMSGFERFLLDYQPVYEMTEASVYNRTERYAGTLDAIVTVGGRKLLVDAKTGKDIYPETSLQLAAYRFAEFVGAPDGSEQPMPEVDGAAGLHLADDGYRFIHVDASRAIFDAFLYVREVFRFATETSKGVLGAAIPLPGAPEQPELDLAKAVNA